MATSRLLRLERGTNYTGIETFFLFKFKGLNDQIIALWLWSPRLTGPLGEFYFTSWIVRSAEKSSVTKAREGEWTEEPR